MDVKPIVPALSRVFDAALAGLLCEWVEAARVQFLKLRV